MITLSLGLDDEVTVLSKLERCNADYLLIRDIHLASESFLKVLPFKLQLGSKSLFSIPVTICFIGQRIILTSDSHHTILPVQLLCQCHVTCLSQIAPTHTFQQLSLLYQLASTTDDTMKYLYTLLSITSSLPQTLLADMDTLPLTKRILVFLLLAFHTHLSYTSSSPPHLHNLLYTLSQLSSDVPLVVLVSTLCSILRNLYTSSSDNIITLYFNGIVLEQTSDVPVSQEFTLPLPSTSVSPTNYSNHIIGVIAGIKDPLKPR